MLLNRNKMKTAEELKEVVKDKYSAIALQSKEDNETSCCGAGECGTVDHAVFADNYDTLEGYNPDADLGLGCGLPTEFAQIKEGDTVIDLGSGAGNDCFVARAIAGESGKVIGLDMTPIMVEKARENADKLGFNNVEFRLGDIENIPIASNVADVVVSNCVLNLVPNKAQAFIEMYRVLKPGGHFSVSDVVLKGDLPDAIRDEGEMYAGCVSGAIEKDEYMNLIVNSGFQNISVQKEKEVILPDEILAKYLSKAEVEGFKSSDKGIYSVTVYGDKPVDEACCTPGSGCC